MDAARRRTTLASFDQNTHQQQPFGTMAPGSTAIPLSTSRKQRTTDAFGSFNAYAAAPPATSYKGGAGPSRLSMAVPNRIVSRQSIAVTNAYPSSSQDTLRQSQQSQGQQNSAYSNLPVPGTVGRASHAYPSSQMLSANRNETGYLRSSLLPSNAGPQSAAHNQYAPPSVRRSSTGGRRQSVNPGLPNNISHFIQPVRVPKDPRPVRDRAWQSQSQTEIIDFLASRNYPDNLTAKTLAQPTGKDFANIFRFLYTLYDPSHRVWGKKFEEEVFNCIKSAGYPFADSISKSHLQAVGNMHSWPGIVAMLHWLMTAIRLRESVFDAYDEVRIDINAPNHLPTEDEPERPQAKVEFWAEYLAGLYPAFLASADYDASPYLDRLEERFEGLNERTRSQVVILKEDVEVLKNEIDRLEKQPSELKGKQKEQSHCKKDMESIQKYVNSLQEKSAKLERQLSEFKQKVADAAQSSTQKAAERADLQRQIEIQGLSEQEIQRLTSDRHQLDEANKQTSAKLAEAMKASLDLEVTLSRNFYQVEKIAENYHALATKLGLLPTGPEGLEDINFAQELNGSAKSPNDIVPDCTTRIRPALLRLKAAATQTKQRDGENILQREEELSRMLERVQDASEAADESDNQYDTLTKELATSKDSLAQQLATTQAAMDQLARQTSDLRAYLSKGLAADDQRLQALENEHQRLQTDVNRLLYDNHEAFAEQLEAIISYKDYVEKRLQEMMEAAEVS